MSTIPDTSNSRVTRMQAWCKLAVLIADGTPEPRTIDFLVDGSILSITVDSAAAFAAWVEVLGLTSHSPRYAFGDWQGWHVQLDARLPKVAEPEPAAVDMTRVREVAAAPRPATRRGGQPAVVRGDR